MAQNSLINCTESQLDRVLVQREARLTELLAVEQTTGVVYFCERLWLESLSQTAIRYNEWVYKTFEPYCSAAKAYEEAQKKSYTICLRVFPLPPLISEQAKAWITYSNPAPEFWVFSKLSAPLHFDWFVQAAHLLHNLNYYLEITNAHVKEDDRKEPCYFEAFFLYPYKNYSQFWELHIDPGGGPLTLFFWRDSIPQWKKGQKDLEGDGRCWFPGCPEGIPDKRPD